MVTAALWHTCYILAVNMASSNQDDDFSEDEWEVQEWRAESFHQDCFLEDQRKKLQVLYLVLFEILINYSHRTQVMMNF